jgi:phage terminase large subunit
MLGASTIALDHATSSHLMLTHKLQTGTLLPYKYEPHPHQERVIDRYFGTDGLPPQLRIIQVWSRRLGKDRTDMEIAALASQLRVMNIWHLFPLHKQARVAIWNGVDPESGLRFIDQSFPVDMVARRSDAQMMLEFCNGSTYQLLGSDAYNSVIGSNPGLVLFSEFALSDPLAWAYISPIIRKNGGGAIFNSTYRGRNHFYKLVEQVRGNPEWFISEENVETALKRDGTPVFPRAEAERELVHMHPLRWREEYLNEPRLGLEGAYFAFLMSIAEVQDRVCNEPRFDREQPVACAWGWAHSHHVWCVLFQVSTDWVSIVGAKHWDFTDPADAMIELEGVMPFDIECHVLPASATEGTAGETLEERFELSRAGNVYLCEDGELHAGIGMVRRLLPGVLFGNEAGVKEYTDAMVEFRPSIPQSEDGGSEVATRPVNDSGFVAAQAMMLIAEFRAAGEPIRADYCALDWSERNLRRRLV